MENLRRQGQVRLIPKNVEETRTIPFIISDGTKDRHNTVFSISGWDLESYKRNNIVGYMHNVYGGNLLAQPNPDMVIGKGRVFIESNNLIGETTFEPEKTNPFAEKIFRKVLFGSLNACSVGFSELERGNYGIGEEALGGLKETYYVGRRELLEYSIVNIPSNRNSNKRTIGGEPEGVQKYVELMLGNKLTRSQIRNLSIYDANVLLEGKELEINSSDPIAVRRMIEGYNFMQKRVDTVERQLSYLRKPNSSYNNLNINNLKDFQMTRSIGLSQKEKKEIGSYSFARAIKSLAEMKLPGTIDGIEGEMHQEGIREFKNLGKPVLGLAIPSIVLNQRSNTGQNVGTDPDGGNMVNEDPFVFIEALKNKLVLQQMGARFLTGLVGNVPLIGGGSFSGAWLAEGEQATAEKESFSKSIMTPKNYRIFGAISKKLMLQTDGVVEMLLREQLITALSLALEAAAINGTGSPAPTGILATAGINIVEGGPNGSIPTWANIVALETKINEANGLSGVSYLTNAKVVGKLKQSLRNAGASGYIIEGNVMNGAKVFCSNSVPSNLTKGESEAVCSAVLAGNFSELFLGMWGGLDLLVDPVTRADSNEIRIVMNQLVDVAVRNPESFSVMADALTT